LGAVIASQSMLIGFALNLSEPEGTLRNGLHALLIVLTVIVLGLLGLPLLRATWDCACRRTFGLELLFVSGALGAFGASLMSSLSGNGPVYYEVVAVLLTVYSAGKALTARAREQALSETRRLSDTFATARRIGSPDARVSIREICVGDRIRVLPGEPIPVDGVVIQGEGFVRETPLTGEPEPVVRRVGDPVMAGGFSEEAELIVQSRSAGHTRGIDALIRRVEESRATLASSEAQSQADRLAQKFLPVVILTALGALFWSGLQGQWETGIFNGLSVLLVACPCALGLATPLGLWQGMATLAARGVIVRNASALERLASVSLAAFDKTGTLTEAKMSLVDVVTAGEIADRNRWLSIIGAVQSRSHHPVAQAFHGREPDAALNIAIESFQVVPARGVQASVCTASEGTMLVRIGGKDWAWEGQTDDALEARLQGTGSRVWISAFGKPVAVALVRERLRSSAAATFEDLNRLGVTSRVLSGDHPARTQELLADLTTAGQLKAGLTSTEKVEQIQQWQAEGHRVVFIGDGINDGPALAAAEVGIGLLEGAPLATATADIVLCGGNLREIPEAVFLARGVRDSIQKNLRFAVVYNGIGMLLAATGYLHPVVAAILMTGSSAVVSWRAWRGGSCHPEAQPSPELSPKWKRWALRMSLFLQAPLLIGLGDLAPGPAALVVALGALGAWASGRSFFFRGVGVSGPRATDWSPMVWGMLGPSNLAMLVGWWADAGFGPVMRKGVCLCCSGHRFFSWGAGIPWMTGAMLVSGLFFMRGAILPWPKNSIRIAVATALALSMAGGMNWGASLVLRWAGPGHPWQFLIAYGGMTAGMMSGMLFVCAFTEALRHHLRIGPNAPRSESSDY
jgi:heavy metal translocating P-type ATPase